MPKSRDHEKMIEAGSSYTARAGTQMKPCLRLLGAGVRVRRPPVAGAHVDDPLFPIAWGAVIVLMMR